MSMQHNGFQAGEHAKKIGFRARRVKGAKHAHAVIRSQGRIPAAEARAARTRYARERRENRASNLGATTAALDPRVTDSGAQEL